MRWTGETGRTIRLLVGDNQPMVAEALAALLAQNGYAITACATRGAEAAASISGGGIDIAVLDIDMIDPSTVTILANVRRRGDRTMIIVTAPTAEHPGIPAILAGNANGLILKCESAETLRLCIGTVAAGGRWVDPAALARAADRDGAMPGAAQLTRRERDVARLVAAGQRNRAIGDTLGISEGTVKMHLHNVYGKLGIESRTQLAMDERLRALV